MSNLVKNPYPFFSDKQGNPLNNGYVYIGKAGLNPLSDPLQAYWDVSLTAPASNIRTKSGYLMYKNSPGILYTSEPYSILVQNSKGEVVFSSIEPPTDTFNSVSISGELKISGTEGDITFESTGDRQTFSKDGENYIWAETLGGYLLLGTNGRVLSASEASLILNADKTVTAVAGISTPSVASDEVQTDSVKEKTSGSGVSIQYEGSTGQYKTKIIDIGDWDMDTTGSVVIAHNLASVEAIRKINVMIRKDSDVPQVMRPLDVAVGGSSDGYVEADVTDIILFRTAAGAFDSTDYDETSYNRGYILIEYKV